MRSYSIGLSDTKDPFANIATRPGAGRCGADRVLVRISILRRSSDAKVLTQYRKPPVLRRRYPRNKPRRNAETLICLKQQEKAARLSLLGLLARCRIPRVVKLYHDYDRGQCDLTKYCTWEMKTVVSELTQWGMHRLCVSGILSR